MYGVFDKAGEKLKKGRVEQEFDSIREAKDFREAYVSKVAARAVSDYEVVDLDTLCTVA